MELNEIERLLKLIEQMILELNEIERLSRLMGQIVHKPDPSEAEYWRGYYWGLKYYLHGKSDRTSQDHFTLINLAVYGCGDPDMAAYACGYHDGFTGKGPVAGRPLS